MIRMASSHAALLLAGCVLAFSGCERAPEERDAAERAPDAERAVPPEAGPMAATPPDTTAEAVWSHLQSANYEDAWSMWPGTTALYPGTEPHGALLTTYVNRVAEEGLDAGAETLPADAMIVKENYGRDSTLAGSTIMYKVEGYDPEHNDWFWAKYGPDGAVESAGRVPGCIECHGERADNDYIMTDTLPLRRP